MLSRLACKQASMMMMWLMSCLLLLLEGIEMSRVGEAGNEKKEYNGLSHARPLLLQLTVVL